MSLIHIARHGQSLGTFKEEEVREGIQSKRFLSEDLVWREGMSDWHSLPEMADAWGWNALPTLEANEEPPSFMEPAWEKRSEIGFFQAFFQTIVSVLFHPAKVFSKMNPGGSLSAPIGYYVLTNFIVMVLVLFVQVPQVLKNPGLFAPALVNMPHSFIIIGFVFFALISPLLFIFGLFLSSSILHLSLKMVGAAHQPWKATCRTFSYGFGATAIFQLLPFGGLLTFFWGFVITFLGLKKVHDASTARICFSILLTFVLFVLLGFCLLLLIGMLGRFYPEYFHALKKS